MTSLPTLPILAKSQVLFLPKFKYLLLKKYVPGQSQTIEPGGGGLSRKESYFPPTEKL